MTKQAVKLAIGSACAAVLLLLMLWQPDQPIDAVAPGAASRELPASREGVSAEQNTMGRQPPPDRRPVEIAPTVLVRVVDGHEAPVAGALLQLGPESGRQCNLEDLRSIGITDDRGECLIETARTIGGTPQPALDRVAVYATKQGFVQGFARVRDAVSSVLTIKTPIGTSLALRILSSSGHPVQGAYLLASRAPFVHGEIVAAAYNGNARTAGPVQTRIHAAQTDGRGVAVFTGVLEESYFVRLLDPLLVPVDGLPAHLPLIPDQGERMVTVTEVHAVAILCSGDAIERLSVECPGGAAGPALRDPAFRAAEAALLKRFPDARVFCAIPPRARNTNEDGLLEGTVHVYGRRTGWVSRSVALRRISEIDQPTVLMLEPRSEQDLVGVVQIDVQLPDGNPMDGNLAQLRSVQPRSAGERVPFLLEHGVATRVPIGEYRLTSPSPFFRACLEKEETLNVRPGETTRRVARLKHVLQRRRLWVHDEYGTALRLVTVSINGAGGKVRQTLINVDPAVESLWLPVGEKLSIDVFAYGFEISKQLNDLVLIEDAGERDELQVKMVRNVKEPVFR